MVLCGDQLDGDKYVDIITTSDNFVVALLLMTTFAGFAGSFHLIVIRREDQKPPFVWVMIGVIIFTVLLAAVDAIMTIYFDKVLLEGYKLN